MSITLEECFDATEIATALKTKYNSFGTLIENPLQDAEATAIVELIRLALGNSLKCPTVYEDATAGLNALKWYVELCTFPVVTELRAQIFALSNDMGKEHSQIKFNPIDNENIEKGTIAQDDLRFNYATNMLMNVEFLIKNNKALNYLLDFIKRDVYMVL